MKNKFVAMFINFTESSYRFKNVIIQASLKTLINFISLKNLKKVVFPLTKKLAMVSKGIVEITSIKNLVFKYWKATFFESLISSPVF